MARLWVLCRELWHPHLLRRSFTLPTCLPSSSSREGVAKSLYRHHDFSLGVDVVSPFYPFDRSFNVVFHHRSDPLSSSKVQSFRVAREKSRGRSWEKDYSDDLMLVYAIKVNRSLCRKIMGCWGSRGFEAPARKKNGEWRGLRVCTNLNHFKQCGAHSWLCNVSGAIQRREEWGNSADMYICMYIHIREIKREKNWFVACLNSASR